MWFQGGRPSSSHLASLGEDAPKCSKSRCPRGGSRVPNGEDGETLVMALKRPYPQSKKNCKNGISYLCETRLAPVLLSPVFATTLTSMSGATVHQLHTVSACCELPTQHHVSRHVSLSAHCAICLPSFTSPQPSFSLVRSLPSLISPLLSLRSLSLDSSQPSFSLDSSLCRFRSPLPGDPAVGTKACNVLFKAHITKCVT